MSDLLSIEQACVRFADQAPVLQGFDLTLNRGEFVSLLGASGCGKSTVLRVVAGLQALSAGVVQQRAAEMAFVFQEPALLPWASLQDNVDLPLRLAGQSRAAREGPVRAVLQRVGLEGRELALPHELSGGMKMRASIARALVRQPDLLLMDEPFAALDDPTRQRLQQDLLQWWSAAGFAVCFVTHQVAEAVFMSTRVLVVGTRPGRVMHEITVDEPFPRTEAFRRSDRFHAACVAVGDALRDAQSLQDARSTP